jgi:hypothetical protein
MIISSTHSRSLIPYVDCCLSWNFWTFKSLMLWKFKVILSCMRRYMNTSDCATYGMNCISLYFLVIPLHSPLQNSIIFHKGLGHLFLRARTCHSIRCGARGFYNSVRMHLWIFFLFKLISSCDEILRAFMWNENWPKLLSYVTQ